MREIAGEALAEIQHLRRQRDELQRANNAEVERRRAAEDALRRITIASHDAVAVGIAREALGE